MTQLEAGEACGVSRSAVAAWLEAERPVRPRSPLVILSLRDDEVRRPMELKHAMSLWRRRVEKAEMVEERAFRSSWNSAGCL